VEDDAPAVFGTNRSRAQVEAMKMSGVEEYDIPAFLRKQAD
jgi:cell division protein FtsZ